MDGWMDGYSRQQFKRSWACCPDCVMHACPASWAIFCPTAQEEWLGSPAMDKRNLFRSIAGDTTPQPTSWSSATNPQQPWLTPTCITHFELSLPSDSNILEVVCMDFCRILWSPALPLPHSHLLTQHGGQKLFFSYLVSCRTGCLLDM